METRIKHLRRIAKIFHILAIINLFVVALFVLTGFWPLLGGLIPALFLYGFYIALDFMADMGEEMVALRWGLQDARRKIIAVKGEEETRVG